MGNGEERSSGFVVCAAHGGCCTRGLAGRFQATGLLGDRSQEPNDNHNQALVPQSNVSRPNAGERSPSGTHLGSGLH